MTLGIQSSVYSRFWDICEIKASAITLTTAATLVQSLLLMSNTHGRCGRLAHQCPRGPAPVLENRKSRLSIIAQPIQRNYLLNTGIYRL